MPQRLDQHEPGFDTAFRRLVEARREEAGDVRDTVAAIVADVKGRGDAALLDATRRYDRLDLADARDMRVSSDEIKAAARAIDPELVAALRLAAGRIHAFHALQRPGDIDHRDDLGVRMGLRHTAIRAVGLYVPGGLAAYPSSLLMNAIPAKVAGVERLVVVVPAPEGRLNPLVLAAADLIGIDEVYRVGGAQAIAALAYGTDTIEPVAKVVGPGNAYVAEAKRQVFGRIGIDTVAGPSEIVVLADAANDATWIAADLLSQAEHDARAQAILVTDDAAFADAVTAAVEHGLETLPRPEIAAASWRDFGAVIVARDVEAALPLVDALAPEHLEIATRDARALGLRVANAGAVFIGPYTPEVIGDYVGGPNHVLPTGRSARFASGLGVVDFMKRTTTLECGPEAFRALAPAAHRLATAEGLDAHARAVAARLDDA